MAARKYVGYRNREGEPGGFVAPSLRLRSDDEPATAYDARDVDPLVEAALEAQALLRTVRMREPRLDAALALFDSEEG